MMNTLLSPLRFLPIEPAQLSLSAVLKCGQTFLWRCSGASIATFESKEAAKSAAPGWQEWSYGHRDRTIVLRQEASGIYYRALFAPSNAHAHAEDVAKDTTLAFLRRYFVLDVSLPPLYHFWSQQDKNFAAKTAKGSRFGGIRVLRQPTWECLIEFICSSNNHISRIEGMLRRLSKLYGQRLPTPPTCDPISFENFEEQQIYAFPRPADLTGDAVTSGLRAAGFGYRDAYVTKTAALVQELCEEAEEKDPEQWLEGVANQSEADAKTTLLRFAGVGPKVADCILLFGLGFEDVVPVDTHVYQIALRDYGMKGPRDAPVSKAMYEKVRTHLQAVWQRKAGWAQQILFTADLRSFADFADPLLSSPSTVADPLQAVTRVKEEERDGDKQLMTPSPTPVRKSVKRSVSASTSSNELLTPTKRRMPVINRTQSERVTRKSISLEAAIAAYPSPPVTPFAKLELSHYFESEAEPPSLAERVKSKRRRGQ